MLNNIDLRVAYWRSDNGRHKVGEILLDNSVRINDFRREISEWQADSFDRAIVTYNGEMVAVATGIDELTEQLYRYMFAKPTN